MYSLSPCPKALTAAQQRRLSSLCRGRVIVLLWLFLSSLLTNFNPSSPAFWQKLFQKIEEMPRYLRTLVNDFNVVEKEKA